MDCHLVLLNHLAGPKCVGATTSKNGYKKYPLPPLQTNPQSRFWFLPLQPIFTLFYITHTEILCFFYLLCLCRVTALSSMIAAAVLGCGGRAEPASNCSPVAALDSPRQSRLCRQLLPNQPFAPTPYYVLDLSNPLQQPLLGLSQSFLTTPSIRLHMTNRSQTPGSV